MEFFRLVPDAVWGAGIGSLITLFGVWLSNRHERKLRSEDRIQSTRKEIFLAASEELLLAKALLAKLPTMEASKIQSEIDLGLNLGKVHIVGSDDTIKAVTKLHTFFAEKLFELMPLLVPLESLRSEIASETRIIENASLKQNQVLDEMAKFNLSGSRDYEFWDRLQRNFDMHKEQISEHINSRDEKNKSFIDKQIAMLTAVTDSVIQFSDLEIEAVRCIRNELGFPFNLDEYRSLVKGRDKEMKEKYSMFIGKLKSET